jgi:hypothetical protein
MGSQMPRQFQGFREGGPVGIANAGVRGPDMQRLASSFGPDGQAVNQFLAQRGFG